MFTYFFRLSKKIQFRLIDRAGKSYQILYIYIYKFPYLLYFVYGSLVHTLLKYVSELELVVSILSIIKSRI